MFYCGVLSSTVCIGLYFFYKRKNTSLSLLIIYLFYSLCADFFLNKYIDKFSGIDSLGFRLFTLLEYVFIFFYFKKLLKNKTNEHILIISFIVFSVVYFFDFFWRRNDTFDSIPVGVSAIFIFLYSSLYLFEQIKNTSSLIYQQQSFWIISSFIIYFAGTLFIFIGFNYQNTREYTELYSYFNYFFTVIRNFMILIGLSIKKQEIVK